MGPMTNDPCKIKDMFFSTGFEQKSIQKPGVSSRISLRFCRAGLCPQKKTEHVYLAFGRLGKLLPWLAVRTALSRVWLKLLSMEKKKRLGFLPQMFCHLGSIFKAGTYPWVDSYRSRAEVGFLGVSEEAELQVFWRQLHQIFFWKENPNRFQWHLSERHAISHQQNVSHSGKILGKRKAPWDFSQVVSKKTSFMFSNFLLPHFLVGGFNPFGVKIPKNVWVATTEFLFQTQATEMNQVIQSNEMQHAKSQLRIDQDLHLSRLLSGETKKSQHLDQVLN